MTLPRIALAALILAIAGVAGTAYTAGMVVPSSSAGQVQATIDAQALAPDACSSLTLTAIVTSGAGTPASELILGTAGADTIDGGGGADCIVAGGGDDTIDGHGGSVCVGGPGTDAFTACAASYQ
jgi:Ca2+-binding RTX toxin-like protein